MQNREIQLDLLQLQQQLRRCLLEVTFAFNIINSEKYLAVEKEVDDYFLQVTAIANGSPDERHFNNYRTVATAIFHLLKWAHKQFNGIAGGEANIGAGKLHIEQLHWDENRYAPEFVTGMEQFQTGVKTLNAVQELGQLLTLFSSIPWPIYVTTLKDPFDMFHRTIKEDASVPEKAAIVSVEFIIDNEPWANPQLLKPTVMYTISGKIKVNYWPEDFEVLYLKPVSTQQAALYEFILPEIKKNAEQTVKGQIVFKYPQHSFDDAFVIRLLAVFTDTNGKQFFPTIIGYDQLIAKVLDPNAHYFITGFKAMNKIVADIALKIDSEIPKLDADDKNNFLHLLSGILNYQGFCLQQGIYKNESNVSEDDFRDDLIQHLTGLPYIGENINKEAHLAGGRVEIGYKGNVAELKVEKSISDRKKIIEKYTNQGVAYSSANTKSLSILCVLDLTEKKQSVAPAQKNIFFTTPTLHGFEAAATAPHIRQVVVIIEGNTKKPSDYSK